MAVGIAPTAMRGFHFGDFLLQIERPPRYNLNAHRGLSVGTRTVLLCDRQRQRAACASTGATNVSAVAARRNHRDIERSWR